MFAKLNHLAITTDQYTVLGMFYRAYMGMKVSGVTEREQSAISVGDGYIGMTLIPRRPGRRGGLDHFGIEVEDFEEAAKWLKARGAEVSIEPYTGGMGGRMIAYVRGPDNLDIEIVGPYVGHKD